jgi:S-(hydroxymethyl)glutathione dehydrogenase / alcohol dehydrogenase
MISENLIYPKTMRGAVLWESGKPLQIEDNIEIPKLLEGQVLIKLAYSGVCHSQLMEVRGKRGKDLYLPHLLGHEGCGQVIAVGNKINKIKVGEWVILGWIKGKGKDAKGAKYNINGQTINSGPVTTFSTYTVVSENRIVPLPKNLPKDIAVLFGCALPTGAGIVLNEIKPKNNSSIGIFGLGGIGLSALLSLKIFKCSKIIAIDVSEEKLSLARKFGSTHSINCSKHNPVKEVHKLTKGLGLDYCVEAAGTTKTIELAFKMVSKNGGKCVFASHPQYGRNINLDPFDFINGKSIFGSWGGKSSPDKDIPKLAEIYFKYNLPLQDLIPKIYSLNNINDALNDIENKKVFRPLIKLG